MRYVWGQPYEGEDDYRLEAGGGHGGRAAAGARPGGAEGVPGRRVVGASALSASALVAECYVVRERGVSG